MNLERYHSKRDFSRTPEPRGAAAARAQGLFVVHKHAARHLHYDLRLEHEGVLESWAVPKGPALEPGEKRLAVRVEDHPLEYGDFEGVIPEGQYGAGTVMIWDRGTCEVTRRSEGRLDFVLQGSKLRGAWSLVRMSGRAADDGKNWLLIKRRGKAESPGLAAPTDASVVSGRSMEQIGRDRERIWRGTAQAASEERRAGVETPPDAKPASLSLEPRPQLATLTERIPDEPGWIHEIKLDGYRILARLENGEARLISRNGKDWSGRFPEIAAAVAALPAKSALLDGEVVSLGADGVSSFRRLQEALSLHRSASLVYHVFDLLYLDGHDLADVALGGRKTALAALLRGASSHLRYTDHIEGHGREFFEQACRLGLEGIICKRADSAYRPARTRHWLKVKCTRQEELLIGGYTDPGGSRQGFGALLLGARKSGRLVYAGKVGTGFSDSQLTSLHGLLRRLEVAECPFTPVPGERHAHWVQPELVAEVEFSEWTRDGALRHPTFRGLRDDRDPDEIRLPVKAKGNAATVPPQDEASVAGVRLSNPDRVLYPGQGITKLALARFYEQIADWILPGLIGRPLSLVRCPQGREKKCFFQKHPGETFPSSMPRIEIAEKDGPEPYLYVRRLSDLISLVQAGTLELHVWGSRVEDVEHADLLVFDLDPAPDVGWDMVLKAALELRERLDMLGLASFVRTTGGKGLHLVVPLAPTRNWDQVKVFAHGVAAAFAGDAPGRLTANLSKAKRQGRIFVDYLRNARGATAIASYSTRARDGAPVAVPVRWEELTPALRSDRYDLANLPRRLNALRSDPWEGFEEARRPLTDDLLSAAGAGRKRRG